MIAEDRDELILKHLPQVRWIASNIHERLPSSIALEDLVSTGVVGLIHAIDNYDPLRNASLRTYAELRIRGAILDSIRGLDGIDPHKRKRLKQLQGAIGRMEQQYGRSASEEEIAGELGIPLNEYHEWLVELRGVTLGSLSDEGQGESEGLLRYTADPRQEDPSVVLERSQMTRLLADAVAALPRTERIIIDLYYRQELTLAEIGRVLDVHLSRVSQLKIQAVLRLRGFIQCRFNRGSDKPRELALKAH